MRAQYASAMVRMQQYRGGFDIWSLFVVSCSPFVSTVAMLYSIVIVRVATAAE